MGKFVLLSNKTTVRVPTFLILAHIHQSHSFISIIKYYIIIISIIIILFFLYFSLKTVGQAKKDTMRLYSLLIVKIYQKENEFDIFT